MRFRIQRVVDAPWFPVVVILLVLLLARAIRVWELGVYWDDWRILARGVQGGPIAIFRYLTAERILMGAPHAILFALFGPNPLAWHVTNVFLEFGIALTVYGLLRRLLPSYSLVPLCAACLFIAYPLSVIRPHMINVYINTAILLAGVSLYLTSYGLGKMSNGRRNTASLMATTVAVALIPIYLLTYEVPVGFEVVRLFILGTFVSRSLGSTASLRERATQVGKLYLPYTIGLLVFVLGRVILYPMLAHALAGGIRGSFAIGPGSLAIPGPLKIMQTFFHTLIAPWLNAVATLTSTGSITWTWTFAWFLMLGTVAFIIWYGVRVTQRQEAVQPGSAEQLNDGRAWLRLLTLSLVAVAALLAPVWISPFQTVLYHNLNSRNGYVATTVAGVVWLSLVGGVVSLVSGRATRQIAFTLVASVLIGLGVGHNFLLADQWIQEWRRTQSTWQQIVERVPRIQEGSLIVLSRPAELKALALALRDRDVYEPAQLFYEIEYGKIMGSPAVRPGSPPQSIIPWLGTGKWETKEAVVPIGPMGGLVSRQQILILDESEGCLKVLDSRRQIQDVSSPLLNAISQFSNVDVIHPAAENVSYPMRQLLLGKPNKDWCYYYAKVGWLQQERSWSQIVDTYRQVSSARLEPLNQVEWLPFIEALNRSGEYDLANDLIVWVRSGPVNGRRAVKAMLVNLREEYRRGGQRVERLDYEISLLSTD